jgi:hypothetical protein
MLRSAGWPGLVLSSALVAVIFFANDAAARNTKYTLPIAGVTENPEFKPRLGTDVSFYFGDHQPPSKVERSLGEYTAYRKSNSLGQSDERGCQMAFLSALLQLRERAREEAGNAVINVISSYKGSEFSSQTEYECHAGGVIAGVALKGTVVKLAK